MLWWVCLRKKCLDLVKSLNFYAPLKYGNRTKIAAMLARDRILKIKGLATCVTSLREPRQWISVLERLLQIDDWLNCLSVFSKWRHNSTLPRSQFMRPCSIRNSTSTGHKILRIWTNPKLFSNKNSPKHEDYFRQKRYLGVRCTLRNICYQSQVDY